MLCISMLYAHILLFFLFLVSLNAAAAAKLCIECISKDCLQSGCMLVWLEQVWYLFKNTFVRCGFGVTFSGLEIIS